MNFVGDTLFGQRPPESLGVLAEWVGIAQGQLNVQASPVGLSSFAGDGAEIENRCVFDDIIIPKAAEEIVKVLDGQSEVVSARKGNDTAEEMGEAEGQVYGVKRSQTASMCRQPAVGASFRMKGTTSRTRYFSYE